MTAPPRLIDMTAQLRQSPHRREGVAVFAATPGRCGPDCPICHDNSPRVAIDAYVHLAGKTPTIYDPPGGDPCP